MNARLTPTPLPFYLAWLAEHVRGGGACTVAFDQLYDPDLIVTAADDVDLADIAPPVRAVLLPDGVTHHGAADVAVYLPGGHLTGVGWVPYFADDAFAPYQDAHPVAGIGHHPADVEISDGEVVVTGGAGTPIQLVLTPGEATGLAGQLLAASGTIAAAHPVPNWPSAESS